MASAMGPPSVTPRKPATISYGPTPHKTPLRTPGGSKIEQTSSTPIIDFDAIESQKENVQPLAKGRSAHALSNTLTMQHKHRAALLATQRAQMEALVTSPDNMDADDPLDAWTKYVKWCIDNYPSGQTHESGLVPLLERATRHFKQSEQYVSDPRYLRLWILYARNVECARDVYNFLLANEIGTKLASLYEELAVVLEGQRLYDDADAMYKLGIARRANPLDRIKRRYEEYKTRIIVGQHALALDQADAPLGSYTDALQAAMRSAGRSMLGHKDTDPSRSGAPAHSQSANVLRGAGVSVPAIGASATPNANNGRKLNVFHENDDEPAASSARTPGASTAGWDDIGTVATRNQENTPGTATAPKAFKIGAAGGISKKPGSALAVFRDSDEEDEDDEEAENQGADGDNPLARVTNGAGGGLGRKPQSSTETDLLKKNPFAYWDKEAKLVPNAADLVPKPVKDARTKVTVSRSHAPSAPSASTSTSTSASASARKEKHDAPVRLLYPSYTSVAQKAHYKQRGWHNEVVLEQLLAQRRGFPAVREGWEDSEVSATDPWQYLDDFVGRWLPERVEARSSTVVVDQTTGLFPSRDVYDPDDSIANAMALNLRPNPKKKKTKRQGEHTAKTTTMSPTLITKATLLEVENMFNGDSDESSSSSSGSSSSEDEEEGDDLVAPLQSVSRAGPRMLGSAADVPPTPTPISRNTLHGWQTDENAGVKATPCRTPSSGLRVGLGGATPLRTPLGTKATPLSSSSAAVFRDSDDDEDNKEEEDADDDNDGSEQVRTNMEQLQRGAVRPNVLETPMPTRQSAARRWIEPMAEEEEEEDEEQDEQEERDPSDEHGDEYQHNDPLFRAQFQPLTPITEATFEFTRYTNMRTPGTASKTRAQMQVWRATDDDETDKQGSPAVLGKVALPTSEDSVSDERSFASTSMDGEAANRSQGWSDANKASFELTKGLTILRANTTAGEDSFERSLLVQSAVTIPNPCSPVNVDVIQLLLSRVSPRLETQPNYVDLSSTSSNGKLAELQKRCKSGLAANQVTRKSMGGTVFHGTGMLSSPFSVELAGDSFEIRGKLGQGGYGAVFLAYDTASAATDDPDREDEDEDEDEDEEEEADRRKRVALKVESPPNRWELYILNQLAARLDARTQRSVISARKFYAYEEESFLVLDLGEKGTLLEVVNNAVSAGVGVASVGTGGEAGGVDEVLCLFFVAQLIQVVLALHRANLIHGDLKIDNCLVRLDDVVPASDWSNVYSRQGEHGWADKGITLIDFGRAIDLTLYPAGQTFVADWETDARDCPAMHSTAPCKGWRFEPDWFGIASVAHCLLFGKYIDLKPASDAPIKISSPFKRYWQTELWTNLFDVCLNPPRTPSGPDTTTTIDVETTLATLDVCLAQMHTWLEKNSNKGGKNLKGLLRKLEIHAMKQQHH